MSKLISADAFRQRATGDNPPPAETAIRKNFTFEAVHKVDGGDDDPDGDRVREFVVSTGTVDREGDTIDPAGWDLKQFKKNPVVLWSHDNRSPPIARAESTFLDGDKLKSRAKFVAAEIFPFADMILQMIDAKILNATSVGFQPTEWKFTEDSDRRFGIDFLKQELLEWSIVTVPANPDALIAARGIGVDVSPMRQWCEQALDEFDQHDESGLILPRKTIEQLRAETMKDAGGKRRTGKSRGIRLTDDEQEALRLANIERMKSGGDDVDDIIFPDSIEDPVDPNVITATGKAADDDDEAGRGNDPDDDESPENLPSDAGRENAEGDDDAENDLDDDVGDGADDPGDGASDDGDDDEAADDAETGSDDADADAEKTPAEILAECRAIRDDVKRYVERFEAAVERVVKLDGGDGDGEDDDIEPASVADLSDDDEIVIVEDDDAEADAGDVDNADPDDDDPADASDGDDDDENGKAQEATLSDIKDQLTSMIGDAIKEQLAPALAEAKMQATGRVD